jgi:hypothetical protein
MEPKSLLFYLDIYIKKTILNMLLPYNFLSQKN